LPDIFDEVEEDLRAERARALGRRYGGAGIACAVLVLVATGGYVLWQQNRDATAQAVADRFIVAANQADHALSATGAPDPANAAPAEQTLSDIASHGPAGYRILARLRLAALQWQTGQHAQAVATWQAAAGDTDASRVLRDLAVLTSAQHQADSGDPVLLKQQLEGLTGADNIWAPLAAQTIALIDIRTGHVREAAGIMRRLSQTQQVPQDIRQMAGALLTTLPADALASAAKPASPASGTPSSAPHG
jgi:hypothetical protein